MDKKSLIVKGLVVGIIIMFIGICVIPSSAQNIEKLSKPTNISIHKIFLFGTLVNYSINETDFTLESHNLRLFDFYYDGGLFFPNYWGFTYFHTRRIIFGYSGEVDFHGILRPHFICGILN